MDSTSDAKSLLAAVRGAGRPATKQRKSTAYQPACSNRLRSLIGLERWPADAAVAGIEGTHHGVLRLRSPANMESVESWPLANCALCRGRRPRVRQLEPLL